MARLALGVICVLALGCSESASNVGARTNADQKQKTEKFDAKRIGAYRLVVKPGDGAEVDLNMKKGDFVAAEFEGSDKFLFEAHAHFGDEVETYGRKIKQSGRGKLKAGRDGKYSFLWAHAGPPTDELELTVTLWGEAEVVAWLVGLYDGSSTITDIDDNAQVESRD